MELNNWARKDREERLFLFKYGQIVKERNSCYIGHQTKLSKPCWLLKLTFHKFKYLRNQILERSPREFFCLFMNIQSILIRRKRNQNVMF